MSFETAVLTVLLGSFIGMGVIIWRKIPALAELSEEAKAPGENLLLRLKNKIGSISVIKDFNFLAFLQKILSKSRVLTLKTENKIGSWLQKLRERSQKPNNFQSNSYWQELKNLPSSKADGTKKRKNKYRPE